MSVAHCHHCLPSNRPLSLLGAKINRRTLDWDHLDRWNDTFGKKECVISGSSSNETPPSNQLDRPFNCWKCAFSHAATGPSIGAFCLDYCRALGQPLCINHTKVIGLLQNTTCPDLWSRFGRRSQLRCSFQKGNTCWFPSRKVAFNFTKKYIECTESGRIQISGYPFWNLTF